jgi:hypothetical protein
MDLFGQLVMVLTFGLLTQVNGQIVMQMAMVTILQELMEMIVLVSLETLPLIELVALMEMEMVILTQSLVGV